MMERVTQIGVAYVVGFAILSSSPRISIKACLYVNLCDCIVIKWRCKPLNHLELSNLILVNYLKYPISIIDIKTEKSCLRGGQLKWLLAQVRQALISKD